MRTLRNYLLLVSALAGVLLLGACAKKQVTATTPPPPALPAPTASLSATPSSIELGQGTTLMWQTANADHVELQGIGPVGPNGSQMVLPKVSTTYQLVAKGAGGTKDVSARVTVTEPRKSATLPANVSLQDLFSQHVHDVFFDYDRYSIRADQKQAADDNAKFFLQYPNVKVLIEGHCDERGSIEYNLALGENRANSVKQALVNLGIPASSIKTISYGKERPFCNEQNEQCWQENRRDHFALVQ